MKKETITETANELWRVCGTKDPRSLCKMLDIVYDEMPLGTDVDSIKGFVQKNNRSYCIILNSQMSRLQKYFILFHEIGHVVLKHAEYSPCTCRSLLSVKETSIKEIEANEFIAEYLLNTNETLRTLKETGNFYATAQIMNVPPTIMDFKWRMLLYYDLVSNESPIYSRSDCMKNLDCGDEGEWGVY